MTQRTVIIIVLFQGLLVVDESNDVVGRLVNSVGDALTINSVAADRIAVTRRQKFVRLMFLVLPG